MVIEPVKPGTSIAPRQEVSEDGPSRWLLRHDAAKPSVQEAMQFLPAGDYRLTCLKADAATLDSLVTRAIPEMIFCKFQYDPLVPPHGPYDGAFLEKHVLAHVTLHPRQAALLGARTFLLALSRVSTSPNRISSGFRGHSRLVSPQNIKPCGPADIPARSGAKIAMHERWLSVQEIAAHPSVKPDTIYKWLIRRKMSGHKRGRLWKFLATEVDEWVVTGKAGEPDSESEK